MKFQNEIQYEWIYRDFLNGAHMYHNDTCFMWNNAMIVRLAANEITDIKNNIFQGDIVEKFSQFLRISNDHSGLDPN